MDRARKRLVSAIDGLRAQFTDADSQEDAASDFLPSTAAIKAAVREKIEPSNCRLSRIVRHGFPDDPRCMAYDPVQKLCAIGAGRGCVRLLGQAGVDHLLKHESDEPVMHVQFLVNEGGLVTALRDDTLHLWNYRQRIPEVVHSLRMSKERVSAIHLPFQSKWLMVGTDKGNVYFVCLATFQLSSFVIYWNKAVDMTCRTHPGAIKAMECCPTEPSKLLLVFEQGHVVLWNIVTKEAEKFSAATDLSPVTAVGWHNDGRQFMCGHQNGSLSIWNVKKPKELVHRSTPHSPSSPTTEGPPSQSAACKPIGQLSWNCNAESEQLIVFSGGMPADEGALPSLTVLRAKGSLTVLEMDHAIVSMLPLQNSPYASVPQHPPAIAVLLRNDLLVVDMQAQGYPCFEVPHPMDLHESPVTLLRYFSDCPVEMIAALTLVGRNQRRQGVRLSDKQWPISGGIGRECATGHQEIMLTGHEDGSIKFWQASSEQLQVMYKLKTGRHFEKSAAHFSAAHQHQNAGAGPQPAAANAASAEEKPQIHPLSHAVADVHLCLDSRLLLVASCSGQTSLFRFAKTECCQEIAVIPLPQLCRSTATLTSPSCPPSPTHQSKENRESDLQQVPSSVTQQQQQNRLKQQQTRSSSQQQQQQQRAELKRQGATAEPQPSRNSSHSTDATSMGSQLADLTPLKVRGGALRRPAGYQPELVCQVPWVDGRSPEPITAISLNSAYGLLAVGTAVGLALVDTQTAALIYAWSNSELLGREPIPFWTSMPSQDTSITSPSGEGQSPPPPPPNNSSSNNSTLPPPSRPNSKSLRARLKHQFSTQTPPAPPPKSPGPLSRVPMNPKAGQCHPPIVVVVEGNTTDSVGQENRLSSTSSTLGPRLHQRPQLIKAFTFNPQANGKDGGEEADTAQQQNCTTAPGEQQQTNSNNSNNCNGQLSVESRASSSDSLDKTGAKQQQRPTDEEFVCALQFINCCAKKGATKCDPCLWLGTSAGASLAFQLQLPLNRITSSVVVAPSEMYNGRKGSIVRLAGRVLALAFLDRNFRLLAGPTENFKNAGTQSQQQQQEQQPTAPANANSKVAPAPTAAAEAPPGSAGPGTQNGGGGWEGHKPNKVLTKASQSPQLSTAGPDNPPASASEEEFSQMALFVAETEVRAVALPAYRQIFHRQFVAQSAEECPLVRATATHIGGQPALVALNAAGALIVLSLPSLRTLLHGPLFPHSVDIDDRLCDHYQLSEHGLGVHMVSPSEVQKFTVSAEIASQMADCLGELFVPCDMPEPPRQHSFFRGVISSLAAAAGAGSSAGYIGDQLAEMDALLSEKPASSIAGSQVRNVARPLPTQQNQQQQQLTGIEFGTARTVTAGQAAREAMQNLSERGERLNAVTDATEQLRNNAMNIQSRSAKLLEKYEKKKWYQL